VGLSLVPSLTVSKNYTVQKIRELPVPGELLVKKRQRVSRNDVIAKAGLPGELVICRISESLGIDPLEVMEGLKVKEGDHVSEEQILCEYQSLFGLFSSRFSAPASGTVELITERTGHIALRLPPNEITLDAYISGEVVEVEEGKSITIESNCAFIQGVFGVGGERKGSICLLSCQNDESPTIEHLPKECSGKVLVGGTAPTGQVLKEAEARGAKGWILGSLDDKALREYLGHDIGLAFTGSERIEMTVIVTEGFGRVPLASRVKEIVSSLDGKGCSLNGATQVRAGAVRPELIIPHKNKRESGSKPSPLFLTEGATVRLIREPYFGLIGTVSSLPVQPEELPTGAKSRVVYVTLSDSEIVSVPRSNVELYS
jgi:hypothetical protein